MIFLKLEQLSAELLLLRLRLPLMQTAAKLLGPKRSSARPRLETIAAESSDPRRLLRCLSGLSDDPGALRGMAIPGQRVVANQAV
jgi:hypothetical protein